MKKISIKELKKKIKAEGIDISVKPSKVIVPTSMKKHDRIEMTKQRTDQYLKNI